jgi:hypothetical protein
MPRLVNRSYDSMAAQKGDAINVPLPSSIAARSITPAVTHAANVDSSPTSAVVTLDWWYEAPFHLSDSDAKIAFDGVIPMQASEAIKALANAVDSYILGKHTGIFSASGAATTTPFASDLTVAGKARVKLNKQLAPVDDRRAVLDPDAEGQLLTVADILNFDKRGDQGGIINGSIGRKLGVDWYMDQNVPSFTPGDATDASMVTLIQAAGVVTAGNAHITVQNKSGAGAAAAVLKAGDIFTVSGDPQQYVVTAQYTAAANVSTAFVVSILPALASTYASGANLTFVATTYVCNLMFHRDAFSWASRPLADIQGLGAAIQSNVDPISGIALRLELSRQYKQTTFSYDILGGAALIRKELATKILG